MQLTQYLSASSGTLCIGFLATLACGQYMRQLRARMAASDGPTWSVVSQEVKIGEISDAKYATLQYHIARDARTYVAQAVNLAAVLHRVASSLVIGIPVALFWLLVLLGLTAPEILANVAAWISSQGDPLQWAIQNAGWILVRLYAIILPFALLIGACLGNRFGFVNAFRAAMARAICQQIGAPSGSEIELGRPFSSSNAATHAPV
ncbi:hypothetical protein ACU4GI_33240 [Cupriavidus basilensis]